MGKFDVGYLSYEVVRTQTLPFKAHVSLTLEDIGKAVTLTDDFEVGLGSAGDLLVGKLVYVEDDNVCTVEVGPTLVFAGVSGSIPEAGDFVAVDGQGCVVKATAVSGVYDVPLKTVLGVDGENIVVLM